MLNKNGFMLINFSIYLLLFCIISIYTFIFLTKSYQNIVSINKNVLSVTNATTISYALQRDIIQAPHKKENWKKITDSEIIWHQKKDKKDIGWKYSKEKLIRYEGLYHTDHWTTKTKSIVGKNIDNFQFTVHEQRGSIKAISFGIDPSLQTISLENGFL